MADLVRLFEHRDFGGRSQDFPPGEYFADRGQLNIIGNDTVSSLTVPFGLCVDLQEHEGGGMKQTYQPGNHGWVGDGFNDRCSYVHVFPWTDVYLTTDDPSVPAWIDNIVISITGTDGGHYSGSVSADLNNDWYSKTVTYTIPPGRSVTNVWEATKNGDASWEHWLSPAGDKISVKVSVKARNLFGARNWIGVRIALDGN